MSFEHFRVDLEVTILRSRNCFHFLFKSEGKGEDLHMLFENISTVPFHFRKCSHNQALEEHFI